MYPKLLIASNKTIYYSNDPLTCVWLSERCAARELTLLEITLNKNKIKSLKKQFSQGTFAWRTLSISI